MVEYSPVRRAASLRIFDVQQTYHRTYMNLQAQNLRSML